MSAVALTVGGDAGTTTGTEQDAVERIRARRADAPEGLRPPGGAAWGAVRVNFVRDFAGGDYPVNRLRNEALRGCAALGARWAITLDVDFMPNAGGYTVQRPSPPPLPPVLTGHVSSLLPY